MNKLSLLRAGFGVAALLVAIITGIAIRNDVVAVGTQAVHEAHSLAKVLQLLIVRHIRDRPGAPFADQTELQRDLGVLHELDGRDVVIVDSNKQILADANPAEVGNLYCEDTQDEVSRTIADGTPRTFIEANETHPQDLRQLVVPLHLANASVGALILEYTPLYDAAWQAARPQILTEATAAVLAMTLLIALAIFVTRHVTAEALRVTQAQRAAEQARLTAEQSNRAKSEFLANMSHELLDTEPTAEQRECLEQVKSSGEALLVIVNDILDFSKMEAGQLESASVPFPLRDLLDGTLSAVAVKADEKGLELACDVAADVPDVLIGILVASDR